MRMILARRDNVGPRFPSSSSSSFGGRRSRCLDLVATSFSNTCVVTSHEQPMSGMDSSAMDCQLRTARSPPRPMRAVMEPKREQVARAEKHGPHSSRRNRDSMILHAESHPPELQKASKPKTVTSIVWSCALLKSPAPTAAHIRTTVRKGRKPTVSTVTPLNSLPTARIIDPAAKAAFMLALSSCKTGSSASAPRRATGMEYANMSVNCGRQ
mmetsp:Transcript_5831/g.16895  ORF Transcript_5831/g.16895 Transcript_5831/m.16895 type:complete len:212 (-) Transcript_5831:137-772(-)